MYNELLRDILLSILDSITTVEKRFATVSKPDDLVLTEEGKMRLDSIAIRLQHIGKSVKKIYSSQKAILAAHTDVKWDEIIQFRDFISHHYEMLNHEIIFNICKRELPLLKKTIEKILHQVDSTTGKN